MFTISSLTTNVCSRKSKQRHLTALSSLLAVVTSVWSLTPNSCCLYTIFCTHSKTEWWSSGDWCSAWIWSVYEHRVGWCNGRENQYWEVQRRNGGKFDHQSMLCYYSYSLIWYELCNNYWCKFKGGNYLDNYISYASMIPVTWLSDKGTWYCRGSGTGSADLADQD